jgi:hypothetical protein
VGRPFRGGILVGTVGFWWDSGGNPVFLIDCGGTAFRFFKGFKLSWEQRFALPPEKPYRRVEILALLPLFFICSAYAPVTS